MEENNIILKIPEDSRELFLSILNSEKEEQINIDRISSWRAIDVTYVDVLITLASAGSLTALASIIKTYLNRNRGKVEIASPKTGLKIAFEGPLNKLPLEQLQTLLEDASKIQPDETNDKNFKKDDTTNKQI